MTELAYALSLGSNLGERAENLWNALKGLESLGRHLHASQMYETPPMYVTDQPEFLNLAVTMVSSYAPASMLKRIKNIEKMLGRAENFRHGPRLIDIDIVLCGSMTFSDQHLTVPHPSFREREFVLKPLAEIAPQWIDPQSGKPIAELLALLPQQTIQLYQQPPKGE